MSGFPFEPVALSSARLVVVDLRLIVSDDGPRCVIKHRHQVGSYIGDLLGVAAQAVQYILNVSEIQLLIPFLHGVSINAAFIDA